MQANKKYCLVGFFLEFLVMCMYSYIVILEFFIPCVGGSRLTKKNPNTSVFKLFKEFVCEVLLSDIVFNSLVPEEV